MSKDWGKIKNASPRGGTIAHSSALSQSIKIDVSSISSSNNRMDMLSDKRLQNYSRGGQTKKPSWNLFDLKKLQCLTPKDATTTLAQQQTASRRSSEIKDYDLSFQNNTRLL